MSNESNERLVDFLYILARDHLSTGILESIMWDQVDDSTSSYCNSYVEGYARDLAKRLTSSTEPITDWKHMYKGAGEHNIDSTDRYYINSDGTRKPAPLSSTRKT